MNLNELNACMALFGDTNLRLAEAIGISPQRLSAKRNETRGAEFTQSEIAIIKRRYNLTPEQVDSIFFKQKVS